MVGSRPAVDEAPWRIANSLTETLAATLTTDPTPHLYTVRYQALDDLRRRRVEGRGEALKAQTSTRPRH